MPNGRPGDRPDTDILVHGKSVYTQEINEMIREIDRRAADGFAGFTDIDLYTEYGWNPSRDERQELKTRLEEQIKGLDSNESG